jgi:NAD-dependent SIR2 family protein deacetylase
MSNTSELRYRQSLHVEGRREGRGQIRTRIVLYDATPPPTFFDEDVMIKIMRHDTRNRPLDAIFVVGTTADLGSTKLRIKDMATDAKEKNSECKVIWINPDDPPQIETFGHLFTCIYGGDCQAIAKKILRGKGE